MAVTTQSQPTLSSYLNRLISPVSNLGAQGLTSLLGGQGIGQSDLFGTGIGTATSLLPLIAGDQANPALTWMAGNLGTTLGGVLGIGSGLPQSLPLSLINQLAPALGINLGTTASMAAGSPLMAAGAVAGSAGGDVIPMVNPLGAMFQGQSDWSNPYSGYIQILDYIVPGLGTVLGAGLDVALGGGGGGRKSEIQANRVWEAEKPLLDKGTQRVAQLRKAGYTDYDIYGLAKMTNLYAEGSGDQITGIYTGPETNALTQLRGTKFGGVSLNGWTYNQATGQWTQESPYTYMGVGEGFVGGGENIPQTEAPSDIHIDPTQLIGSPTRKVDLRTASIGGVSSGLGDYAGQPTGNNPISWEEYYGYRPASNTNYVDLGLPYFMDNEGQVRPNPTGGRAAGETLAEFFTRNPTAMYDWAATHPGEALPEGVTAPKISDMPWYTEELVPYAPNVDPNTTPQQSINNPIWNMSPEAQQDFIRKNWNDISTNSALSNISSTPILNTDTTTIPSNMLTSNAPLTNILSRFGDNDNLSQYLTKNSQMLQKLL